MIYARCYGTRQLQLSAGLEGREVSLDEEQAEVVTETGAQAAPHLRAFATAGVAST